MKPLRWLVMPLAVGVLTVFPSAQTPEMKAMAQQFSQTAKANAMALKMYTWKMSVTVTFKGEPKPPKIYAMKFGPDGKVQKTELTIEAPPDPGHGLRGKVKEKKIAEMKDWAGDLSELCKDYIVPSPTLLQTFFASVLIAQAPGGWEQLYAQNIIVPGDKLTYEIDPKSQAINRLLFHTILEGDPVDGTIQTATVPGGGPTYGATTQIDAPAKKISVTIQNSDYARQ